MNQFAKLSDTRRQGRAGAIAFACGALLALPSCGIPDLRRPEPVPPTPGAYPAPPELANGPEDSGCLKIDEFFQDPLLLGLIQQGLAGNLEQKIRAQEAQIAADEVLSRSGSYLPLISAGGGAGLNKISSYTVEGAGIRDDPFRSRILPPLPNGVSQPEQRVLGQLLPNPLPNFNFGVNLTWQLDVWRQLRNARDAAALRFLSENDRRNYFVTTLVADIAENYYMLLMLDKRLEILDQTIALQEQSLRAAERKFEFARATELDVQRFRAEVRRNQSEKLIVGQQIIEVENRINYLLARYPQRVERRNGDFVDLVPPALKLGLPAQLLQNRPDIRRAERELAASGLDVKVARANFYPKPVINSGIGYQAFNPKYLLITPEALIWNIAGDIVAPLVNRRAIQAEYINANSRQLRALYDYQRTILEAYTDVVNRINKVQNYGRSIELKKQQVTALELSVDLATRLYNAARADYVDVLFAQRDLRDARVSLVETKQEQLAAVVNTYQALGGGNALPVYVPYLPPKRQAVRRFWQYFAGPPAKPGPNDLPPPASAGLPAPSPGTSPSMALPTGAAATSPDARPQPLPPPADAAGPFQNPPDRDAGPLPPPMGDGGQPGRERNADDPPQ